jgi:hypothetical protein
MPFAVATPGTPRCIELFRVRNDLGGDLELPKVELAPTRITEPRFEHHRRFEYGCRRDQSDRVIRNPHFDL